jgi:catechol 2,3-dioxygenase-like lactoylglutathione lyase family enzyme
MLVHHIALRTDAPGTLLAFYRDVVGLPVVPGREGLNAWLRAGASIVMIEPRESGEPAPVQGGMDLLAFASDPAGRAAVESRVLSAGGVIEGRTAATIYFRDPDGRRIGVSCYDFANLPF